MGCGGGKVISGADLDARGVFCNANAATPRQPVDASRICCAAAGLFPSRPDATQPPVEPAEYALMDAVEDRMWWYRAAHTRVIDALRHRPGPLLGHLPVLDAGCGTGGMLRRLADAAIGPAFVGLEHQAAAAARARTKSGAAVVAGDVNALPFAGGAFAAVVSVDVLCHRLVSPERGLAELRRVLAPGGTLVLNLPAFEWLKSAHDARVHNDRRFSAAQVRGLLHGAGFERIETRYWNALLLPLMVVQRKIVAAQEDSASDVAPFPPWLDRMLHGVTALERRLTALGLRFPAGGSVLAVASRP
jgi:SAM-dependent methyltransferase